MPAPRPPQSRRRAAEPAWLRNKPIARPPGTWGSPDHPARRDGPARRRRGPVRGLAAFVPEMTLPAVDVSVLRADADGWLTPGTKMIQRVLPAGQEGTAADRAFPEEWHDGRITRRAQPADVAVQSQAKGRRSVLSASGRRHLAGSRTGLARPATGPGGPYVSGRQRGRCGRTTARMARPGTACRPITRGRAPAGAARTAWPGPATSSSGCAWNWRCGTGATRSRRR